MTKTEVYSRLHGTLKEVARQSGIEPTAVRVLLAVDEIGSDGSDVTSDRLEKSLADLHHSAIRRSLSSLYEDGLAVGTVPGGGPRRPGVRSLVRLTLRGRDVVLRFKELS